ncbi:peptidoglycan-binding protein [Streptomyces sp. NBC_00076]|uniref:peptidoglycan-binding domain-containing protein n=1 Tax=Streptomyces sp. NBC_00076 TaxID=2975642 RepID=UPI00386FDBE9
MVSRRWPRNHPLRCDALFAVPRRRGRRSAVKKFQKAKDLAVDGKVGPNTRAALRSST